MHERRFGCDDLDDLEHALRCRLPGPHNPAEQPSDVMPSHQQPEHTVRCRVVLVQRGDVLIDLLDVEACEQGRRDRLEIEVWPHITCATAAQQFCCLLYTSDAADDLLCVDLGGRRIIKKK